MICTGLKSSIVCVLTVERKHVDDDNKGYRFDTPFGVQETIVINEYDYEV